MFGVELHVCYSMVWCWVCLLCAHRIISLLWGEQSCTFVLDDVTILHHFVMPACCHNPDRFNITQTCSYFKKTQICVSLTSHLICCSTAFMIKWASFNAYMLPQSCVTFQMTMTQFQKLTQFHIAAILASPHQMY